MSLLCVNIVLAQQLVAPTGVGVTGSVGLGKGCLDRSKGALAGLSHSELDMMLAACCKKCKKGKACGDSCIAKSKTCHKGPGCACNAYYTKPDVRERVSDA